MLANPGCPAVSGCVEIEIRLVKNLVNERGPETLLFQSLGQLPRVFVLILVSRPDHLSESTIGLCPRPRINAVEPETELISRPSCDAVIPVGEEGVKLLCRNARW